MALRERNSALHWAATRPEDITPAVAVAVGHFVQVGIAPGISRRQHSSRETPLMSVGANEPGHPDVPSRSRRLASAPHFWRRRRLATEGNAGLGRKFRPNLRRSFE
jgi:hypothetical protein